MSPDHSLSLPWQSPGRSLASACSLQTVLAGVAGQFGEPGCGLHFGLRQWCCKGDSRLGEALEPSMEAQNGQYMREHHMVWIGSAGVCDKG